MPKGVPADVRVDAKLSCSRLEIALHQVVGQYGCLPFMRGACKDPIFTLRVSAELPPVEEIICHIPIHRHQLADAYVMHAPSYLMPDGLSDPCAKRTNQLVQSMLQAKGSPYRKKSSRFCDWELYMFLYKRFVIII